MNRLLPGRKMIVLVLPFIEPFTLAGGAYTILVDYSGASTGSVNLNLYTVPNDLTGTITPGGPSVTPTFNVPGQNALYTLGTPVNSRVSLLVSAGPLGTVSVQRPDGSTLTSTSIGVMNSFVEPWAFVSGQTIKVDPNGANTGSVTLTAYDVPADTTGTVTIGGAAVPVALSAPGQNGKLTFSGSANQQVTVHATGNTMGLVTVSLLAIDGQTVLASSSSVFGSFNLSTVTLPTAGTYTIAIDPSGGSTGSLNISVSNP